MKLPIPLYQIVTIIMMGLIVFVVIDRHIQTETSAAKIAVAAAISEQQDRLVQVADQTKQIEPAEYVKVYIKDCEVIKRDRFDVLLDKLSATISPSELDELQILFYQCGSYFSDVKSAMTSSLAREVSLLESCISLETRIAGEQEDNVRRLDMWNKVIEAEKKNAQYFADLVTYQEEIIEALRSGQSSTSADVTAILKKVQMTREQMLVLNQQIDTYRSETL